MMKLTNLQVYTPDEFFLGEGIQYFKDANGNDWFKSLAKFTKPYSLAIDNETGVIRSISSDTSRLYPVGLTVVEVDTLPDGADISGGWIFDGKKVTPRTYSNAERQSQAEVTRESLLTEAGKKILPLQDAKDLGTATEDELTKLDAWKSYRVLLNRVDTSLGEDIVWPEVPR